MPRCLLLLVPCLLTVRAFAGTGEKPVVYALVLGVGDYADAPLGHSCANAQALADAIRATYRGATVDLLLDRAANQAQVRRALFETIPRLPKNSVIIIYFSGHGMRIEYPSTHFPSEMFLLLHGATQTDFLGTSVRATEILDALYRTRQCTAMVFLDCCFSGGDFGKVDIPQATLRQVDVRAFMLAAAAGAEQSEKGYFTRALLETWAAARDTKRYLKPRELEEVVSKKVVEWSSGFMHPRLLLGKDMDLCIANLLEPSCFLLIDFPNGHRYPATVYIDDVADYPELHADDLVYVRQVARRTVKVVVTTYDQEWSRTLDLKGVVDDYVRLSVDNLPKSYQLVSTDIGARTQNAVALALADCGVNPAREFFRTARAYAAIELRPDVSEFLKEAHAYAPENAMFRFAIGKATAEDVKAVVTAGREDEVQVLCDVGQYHLASNLAMAIAGEAPVDGRRGEYFRYLAALNSRLAGEEGAIVTGDAPPGLQDLYRRLLAAKPEEIFASKEAFPRDYESWSKLAADK